jgi:hypothetical protein
MLHLPDSKTGKKSIVLNAPALAVIAAVPRVGEYVIRGDSPMQPRSDLKRPGRSLRGAHHLLLGRRRDFVSNPLAYDLALELGERQQTFSVSRPMRSKTNSRMTDVIRREAGEHIGFGVVALRIRRGEHHRLEDEHQERDRGQSPKPRQRRPVSADGSTIRTRP